MVICFLLVAHCDAVYAQDGPDLLFREDWKEIPEEIPVNQKHVDNSDLQLHLYGPARDQIKKSHHEVPANHPYYIWSGPCEGNWAVALEHQKQNMDLTGNAKIRWRTHQAGFRQLRLLVMLSDGSWLVSDEYIGPSAGWRVQEILMTDIRWRKINMERIAEGKWIDDADLSNVVQIGFTDLMAGGHSGASSRVDWLEVYAKPAKKAEVEFQNN